MENSAKCKFVTNIPPKKFNVAIVVLIFFKMQFATPLCIGIQHIWLSNAHLPPLWISSTEMLAFLYIWNPMKVAK